MKLKIHESIRHYGKELVKDSNKISPHFNPGTIHGFRTGTKKLRALLRWQDINKNILPASFLKMYHVSGDLRNAQVLLTNLNEENIKIPGFILWLATSIGNLELSWNKRFHKKTFRELRQKLSKLKLQEPRKESLQLFFQERIQRLQRVVELSSPDDDLLHDARKMVKDMQYMRQWCGKNWATGNNITKKFSLTQLKKLSDLAGNYNDRRTGLSLFTEYLDEEKDLKAIKLTKSIQKKLQQQKVKLKKELLAALFQFCKNFDPAFRK